MLPSPPDQKMVANNRCPPTYSLLNMGGAPNSSFSQSDRALLQNWACGTTLTLEVGHLEVLDSCDSVE